MNKDTKLEIIKAIAYGEDIESIANMAEVDITEIEKIKNECAEEIENRRREVMGYGY